MTCCPGPAAGTLTWTDCIEAVEATIAGFSGPTKLERTETCAVAQAVWTTSLWTPAGRPSLGQEITIDGASWFVDGVVHQGCMIVLKLCRAVLECPTCQANIYRLERGEATEELCAEELEESLIASSVPATVCNVEERRQLVDNAEIIRTTSRICLESSDDLVPGDYIYCAPNTWRVERILSPCSAKCLLTIEAILEPWKLHVEPVV